MGRMHVIAVREGEVLGVRCRYTFQTGAGVPVNFVAAAQKGRVYAMAAQTAGDADAATAAAMQRAVETFRCKEEFKPMY